MPKYLDIAATLENRVGTGGYELKPLPRDTDLASELQVSRMTVRKALEHLIDSGVLVRCGRGVIRVRSKALGGGHMRVAYLAPAFSGGVDYDVLRVAMETEGRRFDARIVPVGFVHWEDPVIEETLESFDGVFLFPPAEKMPSAVADKLAQSKAPLLAFFDDISHLGIRSIDLCPAGAIQKLLTHLHDLGHRTIDCINTQPVDEFIDARIQQWMIWRSAMGVAGDLVSEPVTSYSNPIPSAYRLVDERIKQGKWKATAAICTTGSVAMGASRALLDNGKVIGRDVSLCSMIALGNERYLNPTLTTLEPQNPAPYLAACFQWMASGGKNWAGPLHIRVPDVPLFMGQSTGPAPKTSP